MTDAAERNIPKPDFLDEAQWKMILASSSREQQIASSERDVEAYLRTNGQGDHVFDSMNVNENTCVLTTIGRKSGQERAAALIFIRDGGDVVVVGSTAGLPKDPQWWLNLQHTPDAWVQIGSDRWPVRARKATPAERARLWPEVTKMLPLWAHFQKYSEREFPVILLQRQPA